MFMLGHWFRLLRKLLDSFDRNSVSRGMLSSLCICSFVIYQGALMASRRNLFCIVCSFLRVELEAPPQIVNAYVIEGLTIDLYIEMAVSVFGCDFLLISG